MFKTSNRDKRKSAEKTKAKEGVFIIIIEHFWPNTILHRLRNINKSLELQTLNYTIRQRIQLINLGCQLNIHKEFSLNSRRGIQSSSFFFFFANLTSSSQYIYPPGFLQPNKKKADRARKRWKLLRNIFIAFRLKCSKKDKDKTKVSNHRSIVRPIIVHPIWNIWRDWEFMLFAVQSEWL